VLTADIGRDRDGGESGISGCEPEFSGDHRRMRLKIGSGMRFIANMIAAQNQGK
jgi:hypothetical protein